MRAYDVGRKTQRTSFVDPSWFKSSGNLTSVIKWHNMYLKKKIRIKQFCSVSAVFETLFIVFSSSEVEIMLSARVGVTLPDTIIKKVTQRRRKVLKQCVVNDSAFLVCFAFSSVIKQELAIHIQIGNNSPGCPICVIGGLLTQTNF